MNNYLQSIIKNTFLDFNRNKVRTLMTSLGITVGVLAVVLLLAIGLGLKNYISKQFEGLGANVVAIVPGSGFSGGFGSLAGSIRFDERDVKSLQRLPDIDFVAPAFISNANIESGSEEKIGTIIGTSEEFASLFDLELIAGEFFERSDVNASAKVGYMGQTLAEDLYDEPEDAVGQIVRSRNLRIKVIGVAKSIGNPERDNAIMIPYTTTFATFNPQKQFFSIYTGIKDEDLVPEVKEEIENTLLDRYDEDEFSTFEPSDLLTSIGQIFTAINAILVAIGSISLLVGGIGIMNIMYATVTERTREIGIRRSIGATKQDIMLQFLAESTILSLLGGVLGLGIAVAIVTIVRNFFPAEINVLGVILAVGISSFIGVFFGVFPARRAANLTPIEAIRKS